MQEIFLKIHYFEGELPKHPKEYDIHYIAISLHRCRSI